MTNVNLFIFGRKVPADNAIWTSEVLKTSEVLASAIRENLRENKY